MRLRSDIWVAALIRRAFGAGAHAAVAHGGDAIAGAVFVTVDRLDGTCDLYGPRPQSLDDGETAEGTRTFERVLSRVDRPTMLARIASERRFDSDLWLVDVEDRDGRCFIEPPPYDPARPSPPPVEWPPRG
ncbi:DUF1491 family protein [Siculibacillus lacustris]|uniref:DUF1491 family protein n=1 Tax=Siculibacillus lacustris TaxID=1549641 RepID=A0A4Q9VX91_9HYPH|nr:DUF1491 family protein [Siculibacillus lacustris]TBW41003.1 DUF1491 family protein [Siculibacillus lacustris]